MLRVALRGIRAHLVRFVMSLLAVALGVAFVAGTFALRTMLSATFDDVVAAAVQADVYVRGLAPDGGAGDGGLGSGARPGVPLALQADLEQIDGVATVLPEVNPSIVLVGADGTAVSAGQAPSFALLYSPQDPAMTVIDGTAPQGPDEIGLEQGALAASGLALGDSTSIVLGGEIHDVTVTAELDLGGGMAGATIVLLPQEAGLALTAADGTVADLALHLAEGADPDDVAASISAALAGGELTGEADPAALEVVTGDALRAENKEQIGSALGFVTTFLLVFAAIALFVGAFIIANTFAMSVRQRMREFALLRAVGASPAQVFGSILAQAAVVGLLGSLIGLLGGLGLVEVLRVVFSSMGMALSGAVPLEISTVVVALVVGTAVSVAAAALPARRAALVPPVEAMREEVAATDSSLRTRTIIGVALLVLGGVAVALPLIDPARSGAGAWLGIGAGSAVVGMLVVAPALARSVIGVLAWPAARLLRPVGRLARGNVTRNPRRTANTAGALMIGMALVGGATVIAASTQASVAGVVRQEMAADLLLRSADSNVPAGAIEAVEALPEVASADVMAFAFGQATRPGEEAEPTIILSAEREIFGRSLDVEVVDGDLDVLGRGEILVNQRMAADWEVGDTVTLTGATGAVEARVGAIISSSALGGGFIVSPEVLDTLEAPQAQLIDTVALVATDGDVEAMHEAVAQAVAPYVIVSVLTQEQFISSMAAQIDQILVILYALLGLSIVIAVLGIVNTLALSVIERTREIGLLRAVGLGRLQLAGTVTVESVLTAVFGTVVGLTVGVALAATLPTVFAEQGLTELSIPWLSLAGMLALAVLVGVLAALWPGVRAARLRVLDAVSYE